jgi:hypothetical protein
MPRCERRKHGFEDTPEEAQFRAGVRAFAPKAAEPRAPGSGMVYRAGNEDPEFRQRAKAWQARKPMPAALHQQRADASQVVRQTLGVVTAWLRELPLGTSGKRHAAGAAVGQE